MEKPTRHMLAAAGLVAATAVSAAKSSPDYLGPADWYPIPSPVPTRKRAKAKAGRKARLAMQRRRRS